MMNSTNKILIVDDSVANLDYLKGLLKEHSYKVAIANNGKTAIQKSKSQTFDLILLDFVMPDLNGIEVCKKIKETAIQKETPVIFLTASQDEEILRQAFDAGAVDFIRKPFSNTELISRVKNHLNLVQSKKELAIAKEYAESATKAKGEFLANMSHEIRTPMNGIVTVIDFLKETGLTKKQSDLIDIIKTSSDSLLNIINDILDFSKIESGQIELEDLNFNLKHELENVLKPLELRAKDKGLLLKLNLDKKIPEIVNGDALRIKQIIINLVNNAIKFTQSGKIIIDTKLLENKEKTLNIEFKVRDTGIGIKKENQNKLFKSFSQSDASSTRKYGGTGLGLAISKNLVEMMNGNIHLESEYGKGSIFTFNLLLETKKLKIKQKTEEIDFNEQNIKRKSFLIVDDNAINRKVAEMTIAKLGHQTKCAVNGHEAYQFYLENNFDVILMDVHMPELDGIETTELIRKHEKEENIENPIPIIAMTAAAMKGDKERFLDAGMTEYISKPFRIFDIKKVLFSLFG